MRIGLEKSEKKLGLARLNSLKNQAFRGPFLEANKDVNCKISTLKAISAALSRPISDIFF